MFFVTVFTAPNRIVNASPPYGGSGCVRLGHGYAIPTPHSTTVCQPWSRTEGTMLRKPLYGLANRRLQPERYMQ
ncbi:MAG: hypothetical protein LBQ89_06090, partial [Treponema sp.]|nr:hypothetical protein [Treponema sp.]